MTRYAFKAGSIWMNIAEVAVITYKNNHSVYQFALLRHHAATCSSFTFDMIS